MKKKKLTTAQRISRLSKKVETTEKVIVKLYERYGAMEKHIQGIMMLLKEMDGYNDAYDKLEAKLKEKEKAKAAVKELESEEEE